MGPSRSANVASASALLIGGFFLVDPAAPAPDGPELGLPQDFPFRVLLKAPYCTTIPIFALGVEAGRNEIETELRGATTTALARLVSGNLSRAIPGRYGEHRLMGVRRRVGRRNAIYSQWLVFHDIADAEALVRDHPRFGLEAIEAQILSEIETCEGTLRAGSAKGRFNLGPLEHRARVNRAQEYLREAEGLEKLQWSRYAVTKLKESLAAAPDGTSVG
jgi:hypothetical protein